MILRTDVLLGVSPADAANPFQDHAKAQPIGSFMLAPPAAARGVKNVAVIDHDKEMSCAWKVDEEGLVTVTAEADAVALARLRQFTEPAKNGGKITAAAVQRARERGISAEQILGWLDEHVHGDLPALVATAIRNWAAPASVFLGNLLMLEVAQKDACAALLASPRLQPFLVRHIPPAWFIIRAEKRTELEQLLAELGFSLRSHPQGAGNDSAPSGSGQRSRKGKRSDRSEE